MTHFPLDHENVFIFCKTEQKLGSKVFISKCIFFQFISPNVRFLSVWLAVTFRIFDFKTKIDWLGRKDWVFMYHNKCFFSNGVFISQLIRYARACSSYECFILRAMRLSNKLLGQGYVKERLKSSRRKFYGRYGDLTKQYEVPLSRMLHDILDDDHIQWHPTLIGHYTNFWPLLIWTLLPNLTFYLIVQGFHRTYATGAACQQRTLTPPDTWSCPIWDLQLFLLRPLTLNHTLHHFMTPFPDLTFYRLWRYYWI